jgi:hypothetical protein
MQTPAVKIKIRSKSFFSLSKNDPKRMSAANVVFTIYLHIPKMSVLHPFKIWMSMGCSDLKWTSKGHLVLYGKYRKMIKKLF